MADRHDHTPAPASSGDLTRRGRRARRLGMQNMVWRNGRQVHVVHDWDSLTARPEAALAGAAAATFASRDQPCLAPLESSERFLETYQLRAGRRFADEEIEIAWAAGLWLAAHNARMELLYDKPPLILTTLQEESARRLLRANA